MKLIQFLKSRVFFGNLVLLAVISIVLFLLLNFFLRKFTHHGDALTVPDFKGMSIEEVTKICKERNLHFTIKDSAYFQDVPVFTVVDQSPKPLSKVKKNRNIYLTICSNNPPKVELPNLIDESLRQATVRLESYGLKVGELTYVPGIAQNVVIKILYKGRELQPGDMITKGSVVDLVLEDGYTNSKVEVQDVHGLTYEEAAFALTGYGLNIGATVYETAVKDTAKAIIYKQRPKPGEIIQQGEGIDIWLTTPEKYKEKYAGKFENNNKKDN